MSFCEEPPTVLLVLLSVIFPFKSRLHRLSPDALTKWTATPTPHFRVMQICFSPNDIHIWMLVLLFLVWLWANCSDDFLAVFFCSSTSREKVAGAMTADFKRLRWLHVTSLHICVLAMRPSGCWDRYVPGSAVTSKQCAGSNHAGFAFCCSGSFSIRTFQHYLQNMTEKNSDLWWFMIMKPEFLQKDLTLVRPVCHTQERSDCRSCWMQFCFISN